MYVSNVPTYLTKTQTDKLFSEESNQQLFQQRFEPWIHLAKTWTINLLSDYSNYSLTEPQYHNQHLH